LQPRGWLALRRRLAVARVVAAFLLVWTAGGCASGAGEDERLPEPTPTPRSGPDLSDADLWLSFEADTVGYDGATAYPDASGGPFNGRVVTANDGNVERVPGADGSGAAVAFPAKCEAASGCPRAMVEILPHPALNPGEDDFEYGASVWLAPDQTTTGSNIMQKGRFGTEGGLWKLQVDKDTGEPSCVVGSGTDLVDVRSSVSVSDSAWHFVVCRRDGEGLSIRVDDTVDRVDGHVGSVSNAEPVRIGSPGVADQDDQFHGRVDNVFVRIDAAD
jgi:Concanavalin A-like lectin/glucanases superfamily